MAGGVLAEQPFTSRSLGLGQSRFGRSSQRGVNRLPMVTARLGCRNEAGKPGICFSGRSRSRVGAQHPNPAAPWCSSIAQPAPGPRCFPERPDDALQKGHAGIFPSPGTYGCPPQPNKPIGTVRGEPSFPASQNTLLRRGGGGCRDPASPQPSEPAPLAHKQLMGLAGIILLFPTPLSRGE